MTNQKPRFFNENKAGRAQVSQTFLIRKLQRSLNKRDEKEKMWDTEIKAIDEAFVNIRCRSCGKTIQVRFKNWREGKADTVCHKCSQAQLKKENSELFEKIRLILPDTYTMTMNNRFDAISINRKEG
jgi:predicted RNA-binding Zn-ribbon protein involved in translation (DUF1610 family)